MCVCMCVSKVCVSFQRNAKYIRRFGKPPFLANELSSPEKRKIISTKSTFVGQKPNSH